MSSAITELNNLLTRFKQDEDKWENHTKAEYIKRCDDLVVAQINEGAIDLELTGISSYLYKIINNYDIKVSDTYIRDIIPETHTRNYIKSELTSELEEDNWTEIDTSDNTILLEKNQYNEIKINGIEQKAKENKPEQTHPTQHETTPSPDKTTRQFIYLSAMSKLANKFHLTFETLKSRYNESDDIQFTIDKELGNVEEKLEQYAEDWASIENSKGMIDLRRDYGEYEKIMARFMMETGETIARISQIMDYSEKYGSIGILREPKIMEFFETEDTYPLYLRTCPDCRCDISQVMNRNISLYRESKDLNITIPVIKYS